MNHPIVPALLLAASLLGSPLLTAEQQAEWKKIREEVRAELKERWRNRQ